MMINLSEVLNREVVYLGENETLIKSHFTQFTIIKNINKADIQNVISLERKIILIFQSSKADIVCPLLESLGLRYGKDYIDEVIALKLLVNKKKLAVMYGNCQMHDYYDCLNMSSHFLNTYDTAYFKYQEYPRWKEERLETFLYYCDLCIITNERFDARFRNCELYLKRNNGNAKLIKIPTYCFRGYFPQTNPFIQEKGEFDIINEFFNSFHREDKVLNNMIKDGCSSDEIVEKVMRGSTFNSNEILRNNEIALKQIEAMDRVSDVKIFNYFINNYQDNRMFKDPVHMENELVWYISIKILDLLKLPRVGEMPKKEIHYFTQLPIYPEVAKTLGLNWCKQGYKIRIRLQEGMIEVEIEDYIRRYILFSKNAYAIKESLMISNDDLVGEWFPGYGH